MSGHLYTETTLATELVSSYDLVLGLSSSKKVTYFSVIIKMNFIKNDFENIFSGGCHVCNAWRHLTVFSSDSCLKKDPSLTQRPGCHSRAARMAIRSGKYTYQKRLRCLSASYGLVF
jgi:hypothetical protein